MILPRASRFGRSQSKSRSGSVRLLDWLEDSRLDECEEPGRDRLRAKEFALLSVQLSHLHGPSFSFLVLLWTGLQALARAERPHLGPCKVFNFV